MINAEEEKWLQNHFHDQIFMRNGSDSWVNLRNTRKTMQTFFKLFAICHDFLRL